MYLCSLCFYIDYNNLYNPSKWAKFSILLHKMSKSQKTIRQVEACHDFGPKLSEIIPLVQKNGSLEPLSPASMWKVNLKLQKIIWQSANDVYDFN